MDTSPADWLSAVSAGLTVLTAVIALCISRTANRTAARAAEAAEDANATARAVATVEVERWRHEMTPRFEVTVTPLGPSTDRATLKLLYEGPASLDRLDSVGVELRDDGRTRFPSTTGSPTQAELDATVWGPYQFEPGIDGADQDGRRVPARPVEVGGSLRYSLRLTRAPLWGDDEFWRAEYEDAPVRLWVHCAREGHRPWKIACDVPVTPAH